MRLRRSVLSKPGIARKRRGKGFAYYGPDGELLTDAQTLQRIKDLVNPPAWQKVWISPHANGHIQAVGTDAAGRRQYLYHQAWQQERAEEKFDRVLALSKELPELRRRIAEDLGGRGLTLQIDDPEVVRAVRSLTRRNSCSERLLVCRNGSGWADIRADDLNAHFKELVGTDYSVKDLRTWHGTVLAAAFADADPPVSQRVAKRVEAAVMREVAEELGNTAAVARGSYVDPRVVTGYEQGMTIAAAVRRARRARRSAAAQQILETAPERWCNESLRARAHLGLSRWPKRLEPATRRRCA